MEGHPLAQAWLANHRPWRRLLAPGIAVIALLPFVILISLGALITTPAAILGLVFPIGILFTALWWLGRWVPEPRDARWLAFGWGAIVATTAAGFINTGFSIGGGEAAALVISAPVFEEIGKGLVLWILLRRGFITDPMSGAVYAIWSAAGFAIVENILYFQSAAEEGLGSLAVIVFVRGILLPFTHPMFTVWLGLAVGLVAQKRYPLATTVPIVVTGLGIAMLLHALWNGSFYLASVVDPTILWLSIVMFLLVFATTVTTVVTARRSYVAFVRASIGRAMEYCHLTPPEIVTFSDPRLSRRTRSQLPGRRRRLFDELQWSLRTLAVTLDLIPRSDREAQRDVEHRVALTARVGELRAELLNGPR